MARQTLDQKLKAAQQEIANLRGYRQRALDDVERWRKALLDVKSHLDRRRMIACDNPEQLALDIIAQIGRAMAECREGTARKDGEVDGIKSTFQTTITVILETLVPNR